MAIQLSSARGFILGVTAASALWFGVTAVMAYDTRLDSATDFLVKGKALLEASDTSGGGKHQVRRAIKNVDDALAAIEEAKQAGG